MTARFADTFFFFALGNPDDPAHNQAKEFAAHPPGLLVSGNEMGTSLDLDVF